MLLANAIVTRLVCYINYTHIHTSTTTHTYVGIACAKLIYNRILKIILIFNMYVCLVQVQRTVQCIGRNRKMVKAGAPSFREPYIPIYENIHIYMQFSVRRSARVYMRILNEHKSIANQNIIEFSLIIQNNFEIFQ